MYSWLWQLPRTNISKYDCRGSLSSDVSGTAILLQFVFVSMTYGGEAALDKILHTDMTCLRVLCMVLCIFPHFLGLEKCGGTDSPWPSLASSHTKARVCEAYSSTLSCSTATTTKYCSPSYSSNKLLEELLESVPRRLFGKQYLPFCVSKPTLLDTGRFLSSVGFIDTPSNCRNSLQMKLVESISDY